MSITHSLSNALSGMTAASRLAEVVSSNVSNALTDGYARRTLDLSSASIGGRGAGVQISGVTRHVDTGLLSSRRLTDASLGAASFLANTISDVEGIIGSAGEEGSLSARIVAVEAALVEAAANPSSEVSLTALSQRFDELAGGLNAASDSIQAKRVEADTFIADQVDALNTALGQVEALNKDIVASRSSGVDASGLMDTRQQVIDSIAEIVPIKQFQRDNGQVALMTTSGETLIDGAAKIFGFSPNATITPDMTLASGGLGGIMIDGVAISSDGIGRMSGGSLAAAFQARDGDLVDAQSSLDTMAADLISRFQDPGVDPTLGVSDAGLLTDGGAAYDGSSLTGLASRIALNSSADPTQGGVVTNIRDGLNATVAGPSGDSSLLQSLSSALSDPRAIGSDSTMLSAAGRAANIEARVGSQRLTYEADLSFETSRWTSLTEAEAADGVDTDYELQMLLRVEQAYAANARVVQTVDTLMQRLMEI
ncbi:flagellar hook-associated protein FlgK [Octadecabacter sp.]|nr:flagellar hook-associated protein FlgK [Octadecabacter sp.]